MIGDSVRLSDHARERCAQMHIRTSVVKRIVRKPTTSWLTRRRNGDGYLVVASSRDVPAIAVVYVPQAPPVVVTVLWNTQERWDRATYQPSGEPASWATAN
jgi:Domain of unknown function (DUF4258)